MSFDFFVNIEALSEDTCSFRLSLDAQLGTMMKMMVGGKLKEAVDRLTMNSKKDLYEAIIYCTDCTSTC